MSTSIFALLKWWLLTMALLFFPTAGVMVYQAAQQGAQPSQTSAGSSGSVFTVVEGGLSGSTSISVTPGSTLTVTRGVPGPIAGAGLPVLAVGYGIYWIVRRRRIARRNDPQMG
jgi:hypothetical protein